MTFDSSKNLGRPVLVFVLGLSGVLISGLIWGVLAMGTAWASSQTSQTQQNTRDIAALREEYRVINTKLDALAEMLKVHSVADRK
jgi:flagellar motility protein MotE (MotC chaperone)